MMRSGRRNVSLVGVFLDFCRLERGGAARRPAERVRPVCQAGLCRSRRGPTRCGGGAWSAVRRGAARRAAVASSQVKVVRRSLSSRSRPLPAFTFLTHFISCPHLIERRPAPAPSVIIFVPRPQMLIISAAAGPPSGRGEDAANRVPPGDRRARNVESHSFDRAANFAPGTLDSHRENVQPAYY